MISFEVKPCDIHQLEEAKVEEEKSIRWMPWRIAAMKDVVNCEKLWGVVHRL